MDVDNIYKNNLWKNCSGCDNIQLHLRIKELETRIEHLRVSRRVLMNLLEKVEREKIQYSKTIENMRANRRIFRPKREIPKYLKVINTEGDK